MEANVGTINYVSSEADEQKPGIIVGPIERWRFAYDAGQVPIVSSQRKRIYRGTFVGSAQRGPRASRALAFDRKSLVAFGTECANLGRLSTLGVGPRLLAITQHDFDMSGNALPTIIEEDVGENLANLLHADERRRREGRQGAATVIHKIGTPERELENQKILYDVFVQMQNTHGAGLYHRDLRCENVCVRRFGEKPADIRATVIDFELGDALGGGEPAARASLFHTLFSEVPSHLADEEITLVPNPLELDMGYLAALQFQLERDALALNGESHDPAILDDFVRYLSERVGYFGYRGNMPPLARRIDTALDIDSMAQPLGLTPVSEEFFTSRHLLEHAKTFHKPYLDGEDMRICMAGPKAKIDEMIDDIVAAKFESYKALRRAQGEVVEYERYDEQPLSLQRSNYAQVEHIPTKVSALGYLLVSEYDDELYEEVTSFSEEQIEALARLEHERWVEERLSAGWTLAEKRDHLAQTSPYLIPYDELPDRIQEYDRDPVRQIINLVKIAGLKVVRPR